MLYYLGYLTISGEKFGLNELKIPNKVMKELYSDYFIEVLNKDTDFRVDSSIYVKMLEELLILGRVDELVRVAGEYLTRLSNRDYVKFDEKYIKLIFFCLGMNLKSAYFVKSEMEVQRKYPDLLLIPKEIDKEYYSIMIEFKYLKKEEEGRLKEKQEEAEKQIREYKDFEEIKKLNNIKSYTVVAVNDKLYVEEIK